MDDILWNMEAQKITTVVAIDLSAAFDTVDHEVLLDVLNNRFGLDGNTQNWKDSYLRPRNFKVKIGQSYSEETDVKFSVPQGSILVQFSIQPLQAPLKKQSIMSTELLIWMIKCVQVVNDHITKRRP